MKQRDVEKKPKPTERMQRGGITKPLPIRKMQEGDRLRKHRSSKLNTRKKRLRKNGRRISILPRIVGKPKTTRRGNTRSSRPIQLKRPKPRTAANSKFPMGMSIPKKKRSSILGNPSRGRRSKNRMQHIRKNKIHSRQKK